MSMRRRSKHFPYQGGTRKYLDMDRLIERNREEITETVAETAPSVTPPLLRSGGVTDEPAKQG